VIGGGGASSITGGTAGNDVFGFVNGYGGGTETISDFVYGDKLVFGTPDSSSGSVTFGNWIGAVTSQAVDTTIDPSAGGSDVIKLADGTRITIEGYADTISGI
jgi:hypothetical protein